MDWNPYAQAGYSQPPPSQKSGIGDYLDEFAAGKQAFSSLAGHKRSRADDSTNESPKSSKATYDTSGVDIQAALSKVAKVLKTHDGEKFHKSVSIAIKLIESALSNDSAHLFITALYDAALNDESRLNGPLAPSFEQIAAAVELNISGFRGSLDELDRAMLDALLLRCIHRRKLVTDDSFAYAKAVKPVEAAVKALVKDSSSVGPAAAESASSTNEGKSAVSSATTDVDTSSSTDDGAKAAALPKSDHVTNAPPLPPGAPLHTSVLACLPTLLAMHARYSWARTAAEGIFKAAAERRLLFNDGQRARLDTLTRELHERKTASSSGGHAGLRAALGFAAKAAQQQQKM